MRGTVRCGWAARVGGAALALLLALPTHAQLMLAHEGHHDAAGCVIKSEEFSVTFSAYEVPPGGLPPMHSYCQNVPNIGNVNLTIELTGSEARETPFAVRLVKDEHGGHGGQKHEAAAASQENVSDENHDAADMDEHAGHDMDGDTGHDDVSHADEHGLVYIPPEKYKSGIIVISTVIEEKGQYAVLLEKQDDAGNAQTALRIPVSFGQGGGHGGHGGGFGLMEILLAVVVIGGGVFYYMRRKKAAETADKS